MTLVNISDTFRSGTENVKTLSWAYGPEHFPHLPAGSSKGSNWYAMSRIGKSFYAPTGFMVALFTMKEPGTLRDPHWHSNAAEFTYITKGTARITVTGLKKTNMDGSELYVGRGNNNGNAENGRYAETFFISPGEGFISPVGYHHFFESVSPDQPLEGIAIFDTADLKTFDTPQMMKSIPVDILGQVLHIPTAEVKSMYRGFRRVFTDAHDDWSLREESDMSTSSGQEQQELIFKVQKMNTNLTELPRAAYNGVVNTKIIDKNTNDVLAGTHFSFAYTEIDSGATLEPYWVDNSDEIIYVLSGDNIRVIRSGNGKRDCKDEFTIQEGYLAMAEIGSSWLMVNEGAEKAKLLRMFNSNEPTMTTLYDAYHSLPDDVKKTMLRPQYFDQYAMY